MASSIRSFSRCGRSLFSSSTRASTNIARTPLIRQEICQQPTFWRRNFQIFSCQKDQDLPTPRAKRLVVDKMKGLRHVVAETPVDKTAVPKIEALTEYSKDRVLRCTAFCTAEDFNFSQLLPELAKSYSLQPFISDEVHHVKLREQEDPIGDAFVFRNGTFVTWGASKEENEQFLRLLRGTPGIEVGPFKEYEFEDCDYVVDPTVESGMNGDSIIIGSTGSATLPMLAFSQGLARSAKLSVLENALDDYLSDNRHISSYLVAGKNPPFTRHEVLRKLGALLAFRQSLNLNHTESFLDTPDFYWSKPQLEEYYLSVSKAFDVRPRIATLNKKLDYANELAQILRHHLSESHSLRLEWIIIILIAVEVAFEVLHIAERWGYPTFIVPPRREAHEQARDGGELVDSAPVTTDSM